MGEKSYPDYLEIRIMLTCAVEAQIKKTTYKKICIGKNN